MSKTRRKVSVNLKRQLILETGNKCSMPRCFHETGLEIHHIDENPENNDLQNLLLLCAVHHSQATKGEIDKRTCELIKESLKTNSQPITLASRFALVNKAIEHLNEQNQSYRNITVGPLFLNPEWYTLRRNEKVSIPNFDVKLFEFIKQKSSERNHNIRIMFSLSNRYKSKIDLYVGNSERSKFVSDIIENVYNIFGSNFDKGPDVCCCHTGFSNIDMIFDHAFIATYRPNQDIPTDQGYFYDNIYMVENARMKFDRIFDNNYRGQKLEIQKLISFLKELWVK
jgi:hypothetical protein